jgi:hypothetical protein
VRARRRSRVVPTERVDAAEPDASTIAQSHRAASQIAAYYERFGPDQLWGFADPTG